MSNRFLIDRREFLIASGTAVAAATVAGPQLFAGSEVSQQRLAVGYAPFHAEASVVPATSVSFGDGGFIGRGAQVTVSGVSGASKTHGERRTVELLVNHSYREGADRLVAPYLAWASSRMTGDQGNTVRFVVPVDDPQALSLSVRTESGALPGSPTSRRRAVSAAGSDTVLTPIELGIQNDAQIKLTPGYYVIVPVLPGEAEPDWSSYHVAQLNGRSALIGWSEVAPFEHLVLRVQYAG
jgi:hypothetical protein